MARYPHADWDPLPEANTQPRIRPWGAVLHTAVSNAKNIKSVWLQSSIESHFYVAEDGNVLQYVDTERVAHCQLDGNYFGGGRGHISIETWDGAGRVWDGKDVRKVPRWNDHQIAAMANLLVWLRDTHGVPLVKLPEIFGRGIGWHAQYTSSKPPRFNQHHACPAPARIAQVGDVISAAVAGGQQPEPPRPPGSAVSLAAVTRAAKLDPKRPQGAVTPGAADDVRLVERALAAEGLLSSQYASDGSFGTRTVAAYARWQRRCGYSGADADGVPGSESLKKLGVKHGFRVVA
ncbi:peptidoglycan-binding domain-containing protein [Actinopolymorpha sp. NPDC004070]|uniref:peptidoglycan recognition protein family protein n=1 Tax=Actinopolymorpha sp. NPDC004070 TaxID=3154548 RepID=UPI0033B0B241